MRETPTQAVAIAEPNAHDRLCGLLGAMKDGWVAEFEFEGLKVKQVGSSIEVTDLAERLLGGAMLMELATVAEIAQWVENKVELYQ